MFRRARAFNQVPTVRAISHCPSSVLQPSASSAKNLGMASRAPLNWKLLSGVPPSSGALTIDQIRRIGARNDFEEGPLLDLSRQLTMAQADPLNLSQPELVMPRRVRGRKEALKAIADLKRAEKAIAKAQDTVNQLHFRNLFAHVGMPNVAQKHLSAFRSASEGLSHFRKYLETMSREELVSFSGIPDRRKVRDLRREIICWTVFAFWQESGRSLSFTTDPTTSDRVGDLFTFVNAIVECMTNPPTKISGETLKLDLARYMDFCNGIR